MPKAPGIFINELDLSEIVSNANALVLAVTGGASKGPLSTPTVCDNENDLQLTFGNAVATDYGLLTALRFLRSGSRVVYNRVADPDTVATADRDIPGTSGGTPATFATGSITFTGAAQPADGDFVTIRHLVPTANLNRDTAGAAGNVTITLGGSGASGRIHVSGMSGGTASAAATGQVYFIGATQPADGDQIIITDGSSDGSDPVTFEFDSNSSVTPTTTLRQVVIGADAYATLANLIAAINTAPTFIVSAADASAGTTFEFDSNGSHAVGGSVLVAIGANAAATKQNLIVAIANNNPGVTVSDGTVTDPKVILVNNTSGTLGNATILKSGTITVAGFTTGADVVGGSSASVLNIAAISPGTWGNDVEIVITETSAVGAPAGAFDLAIFALVGTSTTRTVVEEFVNLNLDSTSVRYAQSVVNNGLASENNKSRYIDATVLADAGVPTVGSYLLGAGGGTVGANGIDTLAADDIVGDTSGATPTGLKALYDTDKLTFNLACIPGWSHINVINEGIALAEARQDLTFLVDPPLGLTPLQWKDWHNGVNVPGVTNQPLAPLNSSYAAFFAGWVKVFSKDLNNNVWMPPSAIYAAALSYTFRSTGYLWAAVAGVNNGRIIDALQLEASPDAATREIIQDTVAGQRVNPILSRVSIGVSIEGNRTLYRTNSALARLHVRQLLNYLKSAIRAAALQVQWLPITTVTYSKAENLIRPILEFARTNGAFDTAGGDIGYRLVVDDTNNTPQTKAQDRLIVSLAIRPAFVAEEVQVDISIYRTGAEFDIK